MFEIFAACGQGCVACERPVESSRPGLEGSLCLRCRQQLPVGLVRLDRAVPFVDSTLALGPYTGLLGELVRSAKYGGREDLLRALGVELAEQGGRSAPPHFDGIVAVPSTLRRRLLRGFDPVAILARPLPGVLGAPLVPALARRDGARQAGKGHAQRRANVQGTYSATRRLTGSWLLVDDVLTTGTTASACALALREAGAQAVQVWVVAGG